MNSPVGWIIVYALCCAFAWFVGKPFLEANFGPPAPYSRSEQYDRPGAGRGGYSPFFPGPRVPHMRLDPSVADQVDDRRGEHGGGDLAAGDSGGDPPEDPNGDKCWDAVAHRQVPMSQCMRDRRAGR